jgi:hypothetical protein
MNNVNTNVGNWLRLKIVGTKIKPKQNKQNTYIDFHKSLQFGIIHYRFH